jgi:ribonuclease VapC
MIVDSSAIIAIVFKEPEWQVLFEILLDSPGSGIAAPTLVETGIVLTARLKCNAIPMLSRLDQELGFEVIPFSNNHWQAAIEAYERFGKGRHRASLNFGDCMAYATASLAEEPLLYVGNDFAATDIESAVHALAHR